MPEGMRQNLPADLRGVGDLRTKRFLGLQTDAKHRVGNPTNRENGLAADATATTHRGTWAHREFSFDHHHTTKNGEPPHLL